MLDSEFAQNLILLGLTALLTGLLIPYILKGVEHRRAVQEKEREANLARQAKIIEAQSTFLDDFSESLWRWRYLSMKLAYYGAQGADKRYSEAEQEYDEQLWDVFSGTRNEISKARRLLSDGTYRELLALYEDDMVRLDKEILDARGKREPADRAEAFFSLNREIYGRITARIDEVLNDLATELGLSRSSVTAWESGGDAT